MADTRSWPKRAPHFSHKADATAIVACSGLSLVVEVEDPETTRLRGSSVLTLHPSLGVAGGQTLGLPLSGRLRWCSCLPPDGYKDAAMVAAPSPASSRRLLLVAKLEAHLTEPNLRLAAANSAQFGPLLPAIAEPAPRAAVLPLRSAGRAVTSDRLGAGAPGPGWQRTSTWRRARPATGGGRLRLALGEAGRE